MARIKEIMTREIVFFDEDFPEACTNFCKVRQIRVLPDLSDSTQCHVFAKNQFTARRIKAEQIVSPETNPFLPKLTEVFTKSKILFVHDYGTLVGVVHFCDYNKPAIYEAAYEKLYQLERGLLSLVEQDDQLTIGDLPPHHRDEWPVERYPESLKAFHFHERGATLWETLKLVKKHHLLPLQDRDINRINKVRRIVAHSHTIVKRMSRSRALPQYDIRTFQSFMLGMEQIEKTIRQINNRLYLNLMEQKGNYALDVGHLRTTFRY